MKRTLTLVGFIISTVFLGIDAVLELIGLPLVFALFTEPALIFVAVIALATIALVIVSLVFNIIGITAYKNYDKRKKSVKTAIVLNFILVGLLLVSMIMGSFAIMSILLVLALVAANVLAIIDLKNA